MIRPDFIVMTKAGLYCRYAKFYLDAQEPVSCAVISHAHADHAIPGHSETYCTPTTRLFMETRYGSAAAGGFKTYGYGETFRIGSVDITFFSAGHMLGSAMVLMHYDGIRYLYTGDFKLQDDPTCAPADYPPADVLITESTFAKAGHQHPSPEGEIKKLSETKLPVLLGAYALGKAQRLMRLLQEYCPEKQVFIHSAIAPFTRIYEKSGVDLGKWELYNRRAVKNAASNLVCIVTPLSYNSFRQGTKFIRAFASGWSALQSNDGVKLYVSDHADWHDILTLIGRVEPQEVWTTHGEGTDLRKHFEGKRFVKAL